MACGGTAFLQRRLSSSPQTTSNDPAISLYFSPKWGVYVIDRVLIVNGSNQKCCLFRVKRNHPLYLYISRPAEKSHPLFALQHKLIIQAAVAALLIWCRYRVAEIKLFNDSYMQRWAATLTTFSMWLFSVILIEHWMSVAICRLSFWKSFC